MSIAGRRFAAAMCAAFRTLAHTHVRVVLAQHAQPHDPTCASLVSTACGRRTTAARVATYSATCPYYHIHATSMCSDHPVPPHTPTYQGTATYQPTNHRMPYAAAPPLTIRPHDYRTTSALRRVIVTNSRSPTCSFHWCIITSHHAGHRRSPPLTAAHGCSGSVCVVLSPLASRSHRR